MKGSLFLYKAVLKNEGIKKFATIYPIITPTETKGIKSSAPDSSKTIKAIEVVLVIAAATAAAPIKANPRT